MIDETRFLFWPFPLCLGSNLGAYMSMKRITSVKQIFELVVKRLFC
jgi:hypothetical protein